MGYWKSLCCTYFNVTIIWRKSFLRLSATVPNLAQSLAIVIVPVFYCIASGRLGRKPQKEDHKFIYFLSFEPLLIYGGGGVVAKLCLTLAAS